MSIIKFKETFLKILWQYTEYENKESKEWAKFKPLASFKSFRKILVFAVFFGKIKCVGGSLETYLLLSRREIEFYFMKRPPAQKTSRLHIIYYTILLIIYINFSFVEDQNRMVSNRSVNINIILMTKHQNIIRFQSLGSFNLC